MNTPVARPQVTAFVAAVRAQLDDLTADEVDELTDGLEADLNDTLTDTGTSPEEQLGDPAAYAAELRSAAGLPPRAVHGGERLGAVDRLRRSADEAMAGVRSQRWWPGVRDFVVTLRPAWWALRGLVAVSGVVVVLGMEGSLLLALVLGLAAVVASVELGRRRIADRTPAWRSLIAVGNALAVVGVWVVVVSGGLPPQLGSHVVEGADAGGLPPQSDSHVIEGPDATGTGVSLDGQEVINIYPFDSEGRPLSGVQLYDQDGRRLSVDGSGRELDYTVDGRGRSLTVVQVPAVDASGQQRWNVFPLRQRADAVDDMGGTVAGTPTPAPAPQVDPGPLLTPGGGVRTSTRSVPPTSAGTSAAASGTATATAPVASGAATGDR